MKPFNSPPAKDVPILVREFDHDAFYDAHEAMLDACRSIFLRRMDRIGKDTE
jgi:hypothetical protein